MFNLQINLNKSNIDQIQVCKDVDDFLTLHVTEKQKFRTVTCIMEVLANLIEHTDESLNKVIIIVHCDSHEIVIDILDDANFTLLKAPEECPEADELSGRGLWILEQWMDEVNFQPTISGTHLRLSLKR
ncbi:ATP-binding protein [Shewanella surugensis]|uniref:ATP-binding protein n=1 Tax=Shewanella surugensis TaxID=212020 RepID=A0ABT0LCK2_9GAMM|nr:ATP-binding protein [Shewanella surugensis]MCL1124911.1 ATP-binding protein [Shewanella surugensis]